MKTTHGYRNIWVGLFVIAGFMIYGFWLIYLRDFATGHEEWAAAYSNGVHFEMRLAHVHGNLLALMNVLFGYLIVKLPVIGKTAAYSSWLILAGLLMPIGIIAEVYLGLSPVFVLLGAISMVVGTVTLGFGVLATSRVNLPDAS